MLTQSSGQSANQEDILSSAAGAQDRARHAGPRPPTGTRLVATFHTFGSGNTSPPAKRPGRPDQHLGHGQLGRPELERFDRRQPGRKKRTLAGYTVYRNGTSIGTTNASTTTFTDSTVQPCTTYSYTVDAFDTAGKNPHSPRRSR